MSTLKYKILGLFLLVLAAFIVVTNLQNQPETSQKKVSSLVVKTSHKTSISKEKKKIQETEPETVTVQFGLKPNFGPKPTEQ